MICVTLHLILCSNIYVNLAEQPRNITSIVFNVIELICLIIFMSDNVIHIVAYRKGQIVHIIVNGLLIGVNVADLILTNYVLVDPLILCVKIIIALAVAHYYIEKNKMS